MNKLGATCFLLAAVLLLNYVSAELKTTEDKATGIENVEADMIQPLESIFGELDGLRVRRTAQQQGGQSGQGNGGQDQGGRRGPPSGGQGQRGGGQDSQNSQGN